MNDAERYTSIELGSARPNLADEVRAGLSAATKTLPCRYFYDETGSKLFERICELPEYYLTRVETTILERHAARMTELCPENLELVELGCGNSRKTRFLIDACLARQEQLTFHGIDIEAECLAKGARRLIGEVSRLRVVGLVGDFSDGLSYLARAPGGPRLVAFLGSTVGNFDERELADFFTMLRRSLRPADRLLLGVDLLKDPAELIPAYDDSQGVTARFNMNILVRINRELGANFDLAAFRHRAIFNAARSRIEMHLESLGDQRVRIAAIGLEAVLRRGEMIHTENCYKHSEQAMTSILAAHGLEVVQPFSDADRRFGLFLIRGSDHR